MTAAQTHPATRWLRSWNEVPASRLRLVCFPHAGGTAQAYRTWPDLLPADISVLSVQYPGRQDRLGEPCAERMSELAEPLADTLESLVETPLVLFGHSMGAAVAYEVTVKLERRHGPVVDLLVASSALAPHEPDPHRVHLLSDAEIVDDVRRLNPSFAELFEAPDLVELLVPIIRADYRLSETYLREDRCAVMANLLVLGGTDDPDVSHADLDAWAALATARFEVSTFPGGHFYLSDDEHTVLGALADRLLWYADRSS